jgi:hypothetical protein
LVLPARLPLGWAAGAGIGVFASIAGAIGVLVTYRLVR